MLSKNERVKKTLTKYQRQQYFLKKFLIFKVPDFIFIFNSKKFLKAFFKSLFLYIYIYIYIN